MGDNKTFVTEAERELIPTSEKARKLRYTKNTAYTLANIKVLIADKECKCIKSVKTKYSTCNNNKGIYVRAIINQELIEFEDLILNIGKGSFINGTMQLVFSNEYGESMVKTYTGLHFYSKEEVYEGAEPYIEYFLTYHDEMGFEEYDEE